MAAEAIRLLKTERVPGVSHEKPALASPKFIIVNIL
jgi:hypothetical protein